MCPGGRLQKEIEPDKWKMPYSCGLRGGPAFSPPSGLFHLDVQEVDSFLTRLRDAERGYLKMKLGLISQKTLAGKILRAPLGLVPRDAKLRILQGKLRGKKWIAGSFFPGCWLGTYEHEKQILFERLVRSGDVVFDIGAHVGFFTLLASVLVGPGGRVIAFEPLPRNLHYLKEHLRLNAIANAEVIEAAVANESGVVSVDQGPEALRGSFARIASLGLRGSPDTLVDARAVSLDEEIGMGALPLPQHMKIDVEGGEMLVLSGAKSALAVARPTLFLSTHGPDVHQQCCALLSSLGYELSPIIGRSLEDTHEILARHRQASA